MVHTAIWWLIKWPTLLYWSEIAYCWTREVHAANIKRMAGQGKSSMWGFFEKMNDKEVKCKLCDTKLSYHKSTTTMHSHIKAKHPTETVQPPTVSVQPSTASFAMRRRPCDDKRAGQTTALITRMIAQDMLPISFVEGKGFCELMGTQIPALPILSSLQSMMALSLLQ